MTLSKYMIHSILAITAVMGVACQGPPAGFGDRFEDVNGFGLVCDGGGVVGVEPAGIWHMRLDFGPEGVFPGYMRIDPAAAPDGYRAALFGQDGAAIEVTPNYLFVRREWVTDSNVARAYALVACSRDAAGALRGRFATCRDGECLVGEMLLARIDALEEPVAEGLERVGELGEAWTESVTLNVRQRDGVAYLARGYDGLRIVDVSDPAAPRELGHAPVVAPDREFYNDVKLIDGSDGRRYAVVASSTRAAVAIDVTDPAAPVDVARFPPLPLGATRLEVHTLFIEGTRAYLANVTTSSLDIFDLTDPAAPVLIGGYTYPPVFDVGGYLHDLYVDSGRVYLCYWNHGLVIIDTAADPAAPTLVGVYDDYPRRTSHSVWATRVGDRPIAIHGDEDFGAHVRVIDTDPESVDFLNVLGTYQTRPEVSVHNLMAVGELGLVTYYQDGLRLLDLSNPASPSEIGHFRSWDLTHPAAANYGYSFFDGAIGVDYDPDTGLIYLADTQRGLIILRRTGG